MKYLYIYFVNCKLFRKMFNYDYGVLAVFNYDTVIISNTDGLLKSVFTIVLF